MSNIEDNIVSMKFDNKQFESGVATSISSTDKLKQSLQFQDAGKGLEGVNAAARGFNLSPMTSAIQGVSKKWLAMQTVALTAIGTITNKVVNMGLQAGKSLVIDPFTQGFHEYETNLNAVQTIMSNTGANVKTVNKYLNDLNHYSDKTIYNFSEMAKNIGTFTAAGVPLKEATSAIKGIANLAAVSGSNSQQASTAMYQLSQALAAGKVGLQDWNSVVNAGMGGKIFQTALTKTAVHMGELDKNAVKYGKHVEVMGGAFRNSLTPPPGGGPTWLTSDVLTETLNQLSGSMNKAKLAAKGYTPVQIKSILALAKTAQQAATRVKTISQLFDVVKESIGSGWAKLFQDVFGNFKEASKLWTSVSTSVTGAIGKVFGSLDKVLVGWRDLGGFNDLWEGLGNIFKILGNLMYPIVALFKALLPSTGKAGSGLAKMTKGFADVTGWLVKVTSVTHDLAPAFDALGRGVSFVRDIVVSFVHQLAPLLPMLDKLGSYINGLFDQGVAIAGNLIAGWTAGLDPKALEDAAVNLADSWVAWIKNALGIHSPATTMVPIGENIIQGIVVGLQKGATFLISGLQQVFLGMGKALKYLVANISYSDVLDTVNSGLFLGIVLLFKRFVDTFGKLSNNLSEVFGKAGGVLDQFKSNLKSMQNEIRAKALMNIAIAVAVLAGSAVLLASVDSKKLGKALAAIGGLMVTLVASMRLLTGSGKKMPSAKEMAKQTGQIVALSGALVAFSTAILILSGAVAIMGQLDPKTMEQGLAGVAGVIALIVTATAILGKTGGGATILATATAMIVLAAALTAFVGVMKLYEQLDMKTITEGGGKAALVITAIGLAMRSFGKGAISGATGMVVASVALRIMAQALLELNKIPFGSMVKIVVALDLVIGSLVFAAESMSAAEGGALSMLVMAGAIFVLAKALQILGKLSLWELAKGIGAITLAIVIIAGTSAALSELAPFVAALGTALLLVGGALFLAGAGIFLFASALGIMAVVGPAAFQAMADGIDTFLELLPKIGEAIGGFAVSILTGFVLAAGPLTKALGKLADIIIDVLIKLIPKGRQLISRFIEAILQVIAHEYSSGVKVMLGFVDRLITALQKKVPELIRKGTALIIAVVEGLGRGGVRIANATGEAVLSFLRGLDKAINKYEGPILAEGGKIARDLVRGLIQGIRDGIPGINSMISSLAHSALDTLKNPKNWHINSPSRAARVLGLGFGEGAALGIKDGHKQVEAQSRDMAHKALDALHMTFASNKRSANQLMDLKPKITPVLDLSQLEKDATGISAKMGSHSVKLDASRNKARDVAADHAARHGSGDTKSGGDTYEFVQNNYSPKPINHVKVYRGTRSQIALLKEVTSR